MMCSGTHKGANGCDARGRDEPVERDGIVEVDERTPLLKKEVRFVDEESGDGIQGAGSGEQRRDVAGVILILLIGASGIFLFWILNCILSSNPTICLRLCKIYVCV